MAYSAIRIRLSWEAEQPKKIQESNPDFFRPLQALKKVALGAMGTPLGRLGPLFQLTHFSKGGSVPRALLFAAREHIPVHQQSIQFKSWKLILAKSW